MQRFPSVMMLFTIAVLILFSTGSESVYAQIMQNPEAVPLRRLWTLKGELSGERIGQSVGSVGDVNGDDLTDFAVRSKGVWSVYYGGSPLPGNEVQWHPWEWVENERDTVRVISLPPVAGDFWGDDRAGVVFMGYRVLDTTYLIWHPLGMVYVPGIEGLPEKPSYVIDPVRDWNPVLPGSVRQMFAEEMDGSPGDELALVFPAASGTRANIWIYRGGEGFPADSPGVVLQDDEINDHRYYQVAVGDADGDGYTDLVTACMYPSGAKLKFYFGREGSPWNWVAPDRVVEMEGELYPGLGVHFYTVDSDGDGVRDLIIGNYLYRTGGEGNARSRSYTKRDADMEFTVPGQTHWTEMEMVPPVGYLSDSVGRYEAIGVRVPTASGEGRRLLVFGGGRYGPNRTYDAYYDPPADGLQDKKLFGWATTQAIGDVNGDGWNDLLASNSGYGFWGDEGIAVVLGGGPDIPSDDPTVSVQEVPVAGIAGGLSVWPNPVEGDRLNLGWRGDLVRKPERFTVHDVRGELVADGVVEPRKGSAWWSCGDESPGVYLVRAYGGDGQVLATTTVVVRR